MERCRDGPSIWVVCHQEQVYIRTWYRRDTAWYGQALRTQRARIRVPGAERDVPVENTNQNTADMREGIDAAYHVKYGRAGSKSMVRDAAADTTLRLNPQA